jgi:hypothetical protein
MRLLPPAEQVALGWAAIPQFSSWGNALSVLCPVLVMVTCHATQACPNQRRALLTVLPLPPPSTPTWAAFAREFMEPLRLPRGPSMAPPRMCSASASFCGQVEKQGGGGSRETKQLGAGEGHP